MRLTAAIGVALALAFAFALSACGARPSVSSGANTAAAASTTASVTPSATSAPSAPTFSLTGSYNVLFSSQNMPKPPLSDGDFCVVSGAPSVNASEPITVYDTAGRVLATGSLAPGKWNAVSATGGGNCSFLFTVGGIPDGMPTYGVQFGTEGVRTITSMQAHAWYPILVGNQ